MANLVAAKRWGLRLSAGVTYLALLLSLGGMRELYFGVDASWFSARTLAWWATACGCGAAVQVAFALRETERKGEAVEAEQRVHDYELDALERKLRSGERTERMKEREETKRQALQHVPALTAPEGESVHTRRLRLATQLERTPEIAIADIAHLYPVGASTLRKDAHAVGFVRDGGVWRKNGQE